MVTKHTGSGRSYEIENGRYFVWHAAVWEDEGEEPFDVRIPLRFKVGTMRPLKGADPNDPAVMLEMLDGIIPNQADALNNLDLNDLIDMFETWFGEYEALNGATPGEALSSSS